MTIHWMMHIGKLVSNVFVYEIHCNHGEDKPAGLARPCLAFQKEGQGCFPTPRPPLDS